MKLVAAILLAASATAAGAVTYNPFTGLTLASNPNGAYTYGYQTSLGGPLSLLTTATTGPGYTAWRQASIDPYVGVYKLSTTLLQHPGVSGEYSVSRVTLATAGSYKISGVFSNGDNASTDVHVLTNNFAAFNSAIDAKTGGALTSAFSFTQVLAAGSTVDFAVGFGKDSNYYFDSTLLSATVAGVPEPAAWSLLIAGFGLVGIAARRRVARTA